MTTPALVLQDLHHTFFSGTPNEQRALQGVDLTMEERAFVIVLGNNGSGKSTLLNGIAGALQLDRGTVRLAGRDVTRWPEWRRAALVGRVFQTPMSGSIPDLTVAENLAVAAKRGRLRGVLRRALGRSRRRELAEQLRDLGLGLEDRLDTPVGALSGGQRQALTLLMATLVGPELLLLDEHTSALDPRSTEQVVQLTEEIIRTRGLTTLMVTQSMQQAVALGDRVVLMHQGRIVQSIGGARKRQLRVEELLDSFERLRSADLVDQSSAEMLRRLYV
jgi:putative ABC transport system ATP-binding protein